MTASGTASAPAHENLQAEYRAWVKGICADHGITPTELARRVGVSNSSISRQLQKTWTRKPSLDVVRRISSTFRVPIPLALIGGVETRGFAEPDVAPLAHESAADRADLNLSDWVVKTPALAAMGCMPGDFIRFDARIHPVAGDIVIAQVYKLGQAGADTVMRLYMPPFLVAAEVGAPSLPPIEVDALGERVRIMGTMVRRWAERRAAAAA